MLTWQFDNCSMLLSLHRLWYDGKVHHTISIVTDAVSSSTYHGSWDLISSALNRLACGQNLHVKLVVLANTVSVSPSIQLSLTVFRVDIQAVKAVKASVWLCCTRSWADLLHPHQISYSDILGGVQGREGVVQQRVHLPRGLQISAALQVCLSLCPSFCLSCYN